MWQLLVHWFRKKLCLHVCEEFTRWERHKVEEVESSYWDRTKGEMVELEVPIVEVFEYQERMCTQCGHIEREELPS